MFLTDKLVPLNPGSNLSALPEKLKLMNSKGPLILVYNTKYFRKLI